MYQNDLILRAAKGEYVERVPVWMMRQAGRILPEYRAVREKLSGFIELVKTPALAAEVTLQPVNIFNVDAAIIFSDILVIPEAMGLNYEMLETKGPIFHKTIKSELDLKSLNVATTENYNYTLEAIKLSVKELNGRVPVIGFAGAPWTIFAYMTEGKGSKTFSEAKKMLYLNPTLSHQLLHLITQSTINYLKDQVKAGAAMLQLFDSWAGILSPLQYKEFGLKYISEICNAINDVPITVFSKGAFFARKELSKLNCSCIGLDWNMDPKESRSIIGNEKSLQGNMDPCLLYSDYKTIRKEVKEMINAFGKQKYIANLGHGLYPDITKDKAQCFVEAVKEFGTV